MKGGQDYLGATRRDAPSAHNFFLRMDWDGMETDKLIEFVYDKVRRQELEEDRSLQDFQSQCPPNMRMLLRMVDAMIQERLSHANR